MENKYATAIILKGSKLLIGEGYKNNSPVHFLFHCELEKDENSIDGIKRELKEQLNVEPNKIFEFNKSTYSNSSTFLITLDDNTEINNFDNMKISKDILDFQNFKWISLYDKELFNIEDITYLRNLLEELIEKNAEDVLQEDIKIAIENLVFSYSTNRSMNLKLIQKKHIHNMEKIDAQISSKEKTKILIGSLILGILFERFFLGKTWGISYTVFTFMFIGFLMYGLKNQVKLNKTIGWFMLIPICLLALTFTIYSNPMLKALNVLVLPLFITASIILINYDNISWDNFTFFTSLFKRIFNLSFENIFKPFIFMKSIIKCKDKKQDNTMKKDIIKGLLVSLPILFIVIMLLTSADMMFNYYLRNISKIFDNITARKAIWHVFIMIAASLYIFAYLWSFKYPYDNTNFQITNSKQFSIITIITIIISLNIVYLLFSIVQFSYLYGGGNHLLPEGFTYAEYARKGFFELVFVAIINFALILYSLKHSKDDNKKLHTFFNISLSLLVIFTFNMLFSAHYKLSLYENTYGFTYLRVFVHIFMLLLFILFIITLLGIWNKKINIMKTCLITTVIMYVFLNYMNVDILIAKKNIERYESTGKIDINYLCILSYDAAPIIIKLQNDNDAVISKRVNEYIEDKNTYFNNKKYFWGEFNFSAYRAKKYFLK